jgi:mono/diheme cytochrome c family protein
VISGGLVLVGTDRLQAFGLRDPSRRPGLAAQPAAMVAGAATPGAGIALGAAVDGAALYAQRCAACHEQARADVPSRRQLVALPPGVIVEKLAFGSMQSQALGLGDAELDAIARWLASPEARASAPGDAAPPAGPPPAASSRSIEP